MTSFFATPISIGNLKVDNRVFLAPLAGVSDIPFRRICQELGAGLTYVEMLSATAISYRNKKTFEMMARHKSEKILGVQVTGPTAEQISAAVATLTTRGFETIDINMGCPVKKVVSAGCGSALIKDPLHVEKVVELSKAQATVPLTVKCRLGYTRETVNIQENASRIARAGASMLTIHGRTRSEGYSTAVDCETLARGVESARNAEIRKANESSLVIVGNGDVFGYESAKKMQEITQCDAVMVSRGALGNPWVFSEILAGVPVQPTFEEWFDVVMRHLDYHIEYYGNTKLAAILARKHLLWYCKGFPGAKALRDRLNTTEQLDDARAVLKEFSGRTPASLKRFSQERETAPNHEYDPKYEMDRKLDRGVGDEGMEENV